MAEDWSYRYGKPRAEVHYEKYGAGEAPARRGGSTQSVNWILVATGVGAVISGIAMIWVGARGS